MAIFCDKSFREEHRIWCKAGFTNCIVPTSELPAKRSRHTELTLQGDTPKLSMECTDHS